MKRLIACVLLVAFTAVSWAVPKPGKHYELQCDDDSWCFRS